MTLYVPLDAVQRELDALEQRIPGHAVDFAFAKHAIVLNADPVVGASHVALENFINGGKS